MSVIIETVSFGDESKRLILTNAQWAATIVAGTSWNRIRVACRMSLTDSGANLTGTPKLYLGMLASPAAGLTNGPLGSSTSHFVGVMPEDSTWTRLTSGGIHYQADGQHIGKKIGSTRTHAGAAFDQRFSGAEATPFRMIYHVEIEKGSPNFTIRTAGVAASPVDHSLTTLISTLESSTMTGANALLTGYGNQNNTLAVDESADGFLNAICIGWDRTSSALHVSEMFYAIYE